MILLQSPSRFLLQILKDRVLRYVSCTTDFSLWAQEISFVAHAKYSRCSGDKGVDIDCHTVEFDDVRYHIQVRLLLHFGVLS